MSGVGASKHVQIGQCPDDDRFCSTAAPPAGPDAADSNWLLQMSASSSSSSNSNDWHERTGCACERMTTRVLVAGRCVN